MPHTGIRFAARIHQDRPKRVHEGGGAFPKSLEPSPIDDEKKIRTRSHPASSLVPASVFFTLSGIFRRPQLIGRAPKQHPPLTLQIFPLP